MRIVKRVRLALLLSLAVSSSTGCSGSRSVPHPGATSEILGVGVAEHTGAFEKGRWHPGLEIDRLRGTVVRISVDSDGTVTDGSAVALCQVGSQLFLLTAKHVPFPHRATGGRRVALRKSYRIELARPDVPPVIVGVDQDLWVKASPILDVALIRIELPNDTIRLPAVALARSSGLAPGTAVRSFGYASRSHRGWNEVSGSIASAAPGLAYSPAVEPGFSGGPVFDAAERLVGINVNTESDRITRVLPIENAVEAIDPFLPLACPRPR